MGVAVLVQILQTLQFSYGLCLDFREQLCLHLLSVLRTVLISLLRVSPQGRAAVGPVLSRWKVTSRMMNAHGHMENHLQAVHTEVDMQSISLLCELKMCRRDDSAVTVTTPSTCVQFLICFFNKRNQSSLENG